MSVTTRVNTLKVKDPVTGNYYGTMVMSSDSIEDINDIAEAVASMAEFGTDSSLRVRGMAADALATSEAIEDAVEAVRSEIGAPLVAATAAAMTDTDKIYVYVGDETGYTNGNWYYYDGTAWASGGIYNSEGVQVDQQMNASSRNAVGNKAVKNYVDSMVASGYSIVEVEGTEVEIEAQAGTMYVCGELASLEVTSLPENGIVIIIYESGTTATVVSLPETVMMPAWWATSANKTVMIGIINGTLGSVQTW